MRQTNKLRVLPDLGRVFMSSDGSGWGGKISIYGCQQLHQGMFSIFYRKCQWTLLLFLSPEPVLRESNRPHSSILLPPLGGRAVRSDLHTDREGREVRGGDREHRRGWRGSLQDHADLCLWQTWWIRSSVYIPFLPRRNRIQRVHSHRDSKFYQTQIRLSSQGILEKKTFNKKKNNFLNPRANLSLKPLTCSTPTGQCCFFLIDRGRIVCPVSC